jgi:hypothetical protein
MDHGTHSYYVNRRCRCTECRAGEAAYQKQRRERRDPAALPADAHGKSSTYVNYGCRCDDCKAVWSAYQAAYRARVGA